MKKFISALMITLMAVQSFSFSLLASPISTADSNETMNIIMDYLNALEAPILNNVEAIHHIPISDDHIVTLSMKNEIVDLGRNWLVGIDWERNLTANTSYVYTLRLSNIHPTGGEITYRIFYRTGNLTSGMFPINVASTQITSVAPLGFSRGFIFDNNIRGNGTFRVDTWGSVNFRHNTVTNGSLDINHNLEVIMANVGGSLQLQWATRW